MSSMISVYHVTEKENVLSIITTGFEGGWGDAGFGVYVFSDMAAAMEYAAKGGWDKSSRPGEMIILKLEVPEEELRAITPHPEWPNPEYYAPILVHHMEEDGPNWFPRIIPNDSQWTPEASPEKPNTPESIEVLIEEIGGYCPVQAEGTIDGERFYFRARGSRWSIGIGGEPVGEPKWDYEEPYGSDFEAGWMDLEEAKSFILKSARMWKEAQLLADPDSSQVQDLSL